MMHRWFPWRFLVSRLARSQGFLDPLTLYARLQRFTQPSEVSEPVELLRAGAVFHARGLLNSRVLQHNMDWVWPYWVERQFNPSDIAFMPRSFSLTHVNLTNRSWTAIGLPGRKALPIVDPRGLLTPFWDSWSIDVWCVGADGQLLLPSREQNAKQWQEINDGHSVHTRLNKDAMQLETICQMQSTPSGDVIHMSANCSMQAGGWVVVALRPCNPEGVSFIDHVVLDKQARRWTINDRDTVVFDRDIDEHHASRYHDADVFVHLRDRIQQDACRCHVGLVTAAASFKVDAGVSSQISLQIPINSEKTGPLNNTSPATTALQTWPDAMRGRSLLDIPCENHRSLYEAAVRTLVLCTPDDCYAGPFTYKRYWYRDAVFIAHGLLCAGLLDRAKALVARLPDRQSASGYFHSQEGEWDSNGEALWLASRLSELTGEAPGARLWAAVKSGADWIDRKRLPDYGSQPHEGLLPAGFSAEHLGPNDHYYWDNYWSVAGLHGAAGLASQLDSDLLAEQYRQRAELLEKAIERSLQRLPEIPGMPAIPAAPARRLDAGAIGSLVVSYPLQLCEPTDERLMGTVEFLLKHCFHHDGFFQDMIHSGVNAYLTLHVAQVLLRAGDPRYAALVRQVAKLASPTGHWPEAVHPHTGGGCMGDGHHAWAAAEWVAMIRNSFVREEKGVLILGSGILPEWLVPEKRVSFGPALTRFGELSLYVTPHTDTTLSAGQTCHISWDAQWRDEAPPIKILLPGHEVMEVEQNSDTRSVECRRIDS